MSTRPNDAVILQQSWLIGPYTDMLRLTYPRHSAYALAHNMDYWPVMGYLLPDMYPGGWGKIRLMQQVFEHGYEYLFWIDNDAAIVDMNCDLRDALPDGKLIGACEHWAEWFVDYDIPRHYNVGVTFLRNGRATRAFLDEWLASYPGDKRWLDQGAFNELVTGKYAEYFHPMDAKWNATYNVNEVEHPCIQGWHGVNPECKRASMMREVLKDDFIRFRA